MPNGFDGSPLRQFTDGILSKHVRGWDVVKYRRLVTLSSFHARNLIRSRNYSRHMKYHNWKSTHSSGSNYVYGGERREIENNELENSLMSRMFQTFLLPFALFLRRRRRIMSWKRRCTQTKEIKLIFAGAGLGFRSRHCRGNLRKQRAREKRKTLAPRSAYEFCLTKKYFRYKKSDSKFH